MHLLHKESLHTYKRRRPLGAGHWKWFSVKGFVAAIGRKPLAYCLPCLESREEFNMDFKRVIFPNTTFW